MDNKKIPTYIGTIIILIIAFTTGLFVVKIEERKSVKEVPAQNMIISKNSSEKEKVTKPEIDIFGNNKAYIEKRGDKNYVVIEENGIETIVDQGEAEDTENVNNTIENFDDTIKVVSFKDPKFSNTGKYLIYEKYGWEYMGTIVYDMAKKKEIAIINWPTNIGLSKDDKYLFMCTSAGIGSGPDGEVYSLPDMTVKFDLVKEGQELNFMDVRCRLDENKNEVIFETGNFNSEGEENKKIITTEVYTLK